MYMRRKEKGRLGIEVIREVDVCGHVVDCPIRQMLLRWGMVWD